MRILLTGANGYIGKRLLPILVEQGHQVFCVIFSDGTVLIDFQVDPDENVYPHLPAGGTVAEMLEGPVGKDEPAWLG